MKKFLEVCSEHPLSVRHIELSENFMLKKVLRRELTLEEILSLGLTSEGVVEIARVTMTNNEEVDILDFKTPRSKKLLKG